MEKRLEDLQGLQRYLQQANKEVTMVLQSLQWDRKQLLEGDNMVQCSIDAHHRIPQHKKEEHEDQCSLNSQGYHHGALLPDPVDPSAATVVKFGKDEIQDIILSACPQSRPAGLITGISEPLTLERLQATYTWEERRAIHDAVVQRAPQYGELSDLPLLIGAERPGESSKTWLEVMVQQRDLKRRRAKYRVAAKTNNYSDVLRDVIATQMEMYAEVKLEKKLKTQPLDKSTYDNGNKLDDVGNIEIKHEYVENSDTDSRSYQENIRHTGERRDQKHRSSNNRTPSERDRSKYKYRDERNSRSASRDKHGDSKKSYKSGQDRRDESTKSHDSRSSHYRQEHHRKDKAKHEDSEERYKKKYRDEPSSSSTRYYKEHDDRTKNKYGRHEEYDDRSYGRNERQIKKEPKDDINGYENHGSKRKKESHRERDRSDKWSEKETHYRDKYSSETSDQKERRKEKDRKHEK